MVNRTELKLVFVCLGFVKLPCASVSVWFESKELQLIHVYAAKFQNAWVT